MIILRGERARQLHARTQSVIISSPGPAAVGRAPASSASARQRARADDERSLDLVQRLLISTLLTVIFGAPTAALALYAPLLAQTDRTSGTGLWVMCAVLGLMGVTAVRVVHRRPPLSIWLLLGLVPAAVSSLWLF